MLRILSSFAIVLICFLLFKCEKTQTPQKHSHSYSYQKPLPQPEIFAEKVISTELPEFATSFSPDGKTVYFNLASADRKILKIMGKLESLQSARKFLARKNQKKPKILQEDTKFLEKIFFEDAQKTQEILGRSLPWSFLKK